MNVALGKSVALTLVMVKLISLTRVKGVIAGTPLKFIAAGTEMVTGVPLPVATRGVGAGAPLKSIGVDTSPSTAGVKVMVTVCGGDAGVRAV